MRMDHQIANLFRRLADWHQTTKGGEIPCPVALADVSVELPPPEVTWTLLGLMHCLSRKTQAWTELEKLAEKRRDGDSGRSGRLEDILGRSGSFGDHPEWQYVLDSQSSVVHNLVTGERLHLDAHSGPRPIATWQFSERIQQLRRPGPAEWRLNELFPDTRGLMVAINYLRACGMFRVIEEFERDILVFELDRTLDGHLEAVRAFLRAWALPDQRIALGTLIGDWPAVRDAAMATGDTDIAAVAAPRAEESRCQWLNVVRCEAHRGLYGDVLHALGNCRAEDLPKWIERGFADPNLVRAAIEVVRDDPGWCPRVYEVFRRSLNDRDFDHTKGPAALCLARHGHSVDALLDALLAEPSPDLIAAIELALEHLPGRLVEVVRRALRSPSSGVRLTGAAVLALIDVDWTRRELLAWLGQSDDPAMTCECRAALQWSADPVARRAAHEWEKRHPDESSDSSSDENWLDGGCEQAIKRPMEEWGERVALAAARAGWRERRGLAAFRMSRLPG